MLSKKRFTTIFLICLSFFAFAQNDLRQDSDPAETYGGEGSLLDLLMGDKDEINENSSWQGNAEANKISQPFAWESAGDVQKYEIIIYGVDENTGNVTGEVYRHETTEEENETCLIYIDPVLPPGLYRSEILVYNVLGGLEENYGSVEDFYVRQAYKPEIRNVSYPLFMRSIIYLDDLDNNGIVEVSGRNLFESKEDEDDLVFTEYYLQNERRTIRPKAILSTEKNGRKVTMQFNMRELAVGEYNMMAQDASGLHTEPNSSSSLVVKFKKLVDVDIEAGYILPVVLHDDTIRTYMDKVIYPISFQGRVTVVPMKYVWGYLGTGLRFSYTRLSKEFENYSIDGNLMNMHLLFVCQLPFLRRRLFIEPHLGAGLTSFSNVQFHFPHDIHSRPLDTFSFSIDAGVSAQYYFNKRLYLEGALDYTLAINADMLMGDVSPSIGVGWQF